MDAPSPISRRRLPANPIELAQFLIGKRLVRVLRSSLLIGRIVETEAYLPDDPASHSFFGSSVRNRSMFLRRGHAYVYRIYGRWFCLNVSAGAAGEGAGVLLRALEPLVGLETMRRRRGAPSDRDLTRGPGRLCDALGIDQACDGMDLCRGERLWLGAVSEPAPAIGCSGRIGITKAADLPLRFYERGNRCVSGPRMV